MNAETISHSPNQNAISDTENPFATQRFGTLAHLKRAKSKAARAFVLEESTRRARHLTYALWLDSYVGGETTAGDWLNLRPDHGTLPDDARVAMAFEGDHELDDVKRIRRALWIVPPDFDPEKYYWPDVDALYARWREGDSTIAFEAFDVKELQQ